MTCTKVDIRRKGEPIEGEVEGRNECVSPSNMFARQRPGLRLFLKADDRFPDSELLGVPKLLRLYSRSMTNIR